MAHLHLKKINSVDELTDENYIAHEEKQCMTCCKNSNEKRSQPKMLSNRKDERDFKIIV